MISILFLSADPTDATRLRLGEEAREIEEKIQMSRWRDNFEFHVKLSVRPPDLSQALLDLGPQIVHFSGHGNAEGAICVENKTGHSMPVSAEALAALFENFTDQLNCVILNACYSAKQAEAIARYIPYVIGMNKEVGDAAAVAFSIGFYQALGAGRPIDRAFKLGVAQIRIQGIPDHLVPVMIGKSAAAPQAQTQPAGEERPAVDPAQVRALFDEFKRYIEQQGGLPQTAPQRPTVTVDPELKAQLVQILAEYGIDADQMVPEARFVEDLGLDSLDTIELVMAVEDQFNIELPDEEIVNIQTVGDGLDYIQRKLREH